MRDDRAWCLTIYGHGLITQEQYEKAEEQLEKAGELHYKLVREGMDEDNLTWNLFTLAAAQYRLQKRSQDAAGNFLEACNRLRTMMKKKKKIWFSDYLDDIFNKLQRSDKVEEEVCKSIPDLQKWLSPDSVRKGKNALDNIIKNLEKARPQTHNKEYIR